MAASKDSWRKLLYWLDDPEWSPHTAACILIGLDPNEVYEPVGHQGFSYSWLTRYQLGGLPVDEYSRSKNVEMAFNTAKRLTRSADPRHVATPHEWIRWSIEVRMEPPWLRQAYSREGIADRMPYGLAPMKDHDPPRQTFSEYQSSAGKISQAKRPAGKAKKALLPKIRQALREAPNQQIEALATRLQHSLPGSEVWAKHSTIKTWIREEKKRLRRDASQSVG